VNPGSLEPWSVSTFNIFPNLVILLYERGWYLTYRYWPTSTGTHDWEMEYWFPASRSPRERIQHEVTAAMSKEAGIQDMATLDGTQQGLESGAVERFPLSDQEITVRHFHTVVADWVDDYLRERNGARG
jgi:Rieske 2Fe-2S family protein